MTLAGRLLKVIHYVVAPDQTCGVPQRFVGENVALLQDVVHYAKAANLPVAVLFLDQEKAFNRIDWPFLLSSLLKTVGIDVDEIISIQRKGSNHSWVVSFATPKAKEDVLSDFPVFLGDCENRTVLVKSYEAPHKMPNTL